MLDGVIELNKTNYASTFISDKFGYGIIALLVLVLICAIVLSVKEVNKKVTELIGCTLITLSVFCLTFAISSMIFNAKNCEVVECTLDDSVPFLELTEHYEILDQRGQIYTLHQIKDLEEDFNFTCDVCASDPDVTISISTLEGGRYRVVVTTACPNCFNAIKTTVVTTDISNLYDRVNVAKIRWREALSAKQDEEENLIGE